MEEEPVEQTPPEPPPPPVEGEALAAWKVGGRAYLVVRVAGDGPNGEEVEYLGSVAEEDLARLSVVEQRLALLGAVKVERDHRRALAAVSIQELVGPVTL